MPFLQTPLPHYQQQFDGDCLPACAAMVLSYLGVRISYRRLVRLLETRKQVGTIRSNIRNLAKLGLKVDYQAGTLTDLRYHLENDRPCIIFVNTGELPYWERTTFHAVVLIGMDEQFAYIHDPDLPNAPTAVLLGNLDLSWFGQDEMYATISR